MGIAWNYAAGFWEMNPAIAFVPPFSHLHKADKTRGKAESSFLMWVAVSLVAKGGPYSQMPESEREQRMVEGGLVTEEWLEREGAKARTLAAVFRETFLEGAAHRALRSWENKMEQRREFLDGLAYGEGTAELLDKMMGATKKLYDDYFRIRKEMESEEDDVAAGGREQSFLEKAKVK